MLNLLQIFPLIATSTLQEVKYQMEKLSLRALRNLPQITQLVKKTTPLNSTQFPWKILIVKCT